MSLKILCSGFLIRYPVGGFSWHHLQYLRGFQDMGHEVIYLEDYGWAHSCFDPDRGCMTDDPSYGIRYLERLLLDTGCRCRWCYCASDGKVYGLPREELAEYCEECDVYFNLSNINWIPELNSCQRRVLVDTDPVFTQIKAHGLGGPFTRYHTRFTYGENMHLPVCTMPTGGTTWLPTRQPVVRELWTVCDPEPEASLTTVMNFSAYGEHEYKGRRFGQKNIEFRDYEDLPSRVDMPMEIALNAPPKVRDRLREKGWRIVNPLDATRTPADYQEYIRRSLGEFSVAKHGYVTTRSGWFSDRSCAYLATGRPVVLQDTGFSSIIPCGAGLLTFRQPSEAMAVIGMLRKDYEYHCRQARRLVEEYFNAERVLGDLLEKSL